jgi:hypothetical protein
MCFSHFANKGPEVSAFIEQIEDKLGVVPKSVFGPTKRPAITWLRPSPWWMNSSLKRSLFTAFLRAGNNYNGRDFEEALWSNSYLSDTRYAVNRFLAGYTKYQGRGNQTGWWNIFYLGGAYDRWCTPEPLNPFSVDKLLVKPK